MSNEEKGWILYLGFLALTIVLMPVCMIAEQINAKRAEEAEYKQRIEEAEIREREEKQLETLVQKSIEKLEENGYKFEFYNRHYYRYVFLKKQPYPYGGKKIGLSADQVISIAREL